MKVLVTGASGFVGAELVSLLKEQGHEVLPLVRDREQVGERTVFWDPLGDKIEADKMEGADVLVHLAGKNLAESRWSEEVKRLIRDSRVQGTRLLATTLRGLHNPPPVFLCASAVGFYGNTGDAIATEESPRGTGFLADVCVDWEEEADKAKKANIRVVNMRFGFVLSPKGGGLAQMLPPFKMGLGGVLGSGEQYMSWVTLDDLLSIILFCIHNSSIEGPVNCVAPEPVTNVVFTKNLGKILHRPTVAKMPAFAAGLLFGEMADEMLLSSCRAVPKKLEEGGYSFLYPELQEALQHQLG